MALLDQDAPAVDYAQRAFETMKNDYISLWRQMLFYRKRMFDTLWHNDDNVPPAEILAKLGGNGYELFQSGAALTQLILSVDPTALQPEDYTPPVELQFNPDGTVQIAAIVE